ncbi:MAG: superinfection exclusion B family protein [Parashewanella sp.]
MKLAIKSCLDMSQKYFTPKQWLFKSMLWLIICSSSLLFMPSSLLETLGLTALHSQNIHFIGLGLIIASAYFVSRMCDHLLDLAIQHYRNKKITELVESKVKLLDPAERAVLREFFLQSSAILTLPKDDIAVKSLLDNHIIECIGNEKHYAIQGPTAEFKISMPARSQLNRATLKLPSGTPSEIEMKKLIKSRPMFVSSVSQQRKQAA